jgi:hypothetical protein
LTNINYWIGRHDVGGIEYTLVDHGANGGVCGEDMLVVKESVHFVEIEEDEEEQSASQKIVMMR